MNTELLKNIIKSTKEVRKKFKAIKSGKIDTEALLEETFKPITKPLKTLKSESKIESDILDKLKSEIKDESSFLKAPIKPERKVSLENSFNSFETPKSSSPSTTIVTAKRLPLSHSTPLRSSLSLSHDDDDIKSLASYYTNRYMKGYSIDNAYGPKLNQETKSFEIGRSKLTFDDNIINVEGNKYTATPGLYELIFKKDPSSYTAEDLANYKEILLKSNVFRKDVHDETSRVKGHGGRKYKDIIRKLIEEKKGGGLMQLQMGKPNYIYWDDPNELVERLKLLIASQQAGHTNHNNEIISIIEELREANIIV